MSSRPSRGAARLAAILDALPDALLLVNANGTVVNANSIALDVMEAPGTALVGRGLLDLLPEFDSRLIPGSMRRPDSRDERGRTKPNRMTARRTDGVEFPVEVTSASLEDGRQAYDTHSFTGDELLMIVVRDLSGTVDTEAELARSQRQTEMILRAASEGVVGTDIEGRIVLVNPAAAQILGYRATELGGQKLHDLTLHSRGDGEPFGYEESPLADTLRSGRKHRVRGQVMWAKSGKPVPVDLTTAPVRDGDLLVGAVLTFTDRRPQEELSARHESELTELRERHAAELAELKETYETDLADRMERYDAGLAAREERLEALTGRHGQLLAVLSDGLRGPLEELRRELGTLAADPAGQLWPEANQILHHLAAGYARMTTLVDNVLAYQRLDEGAERLEPKKVLLDGVVAAGVEGAVELIGPGRAQFAVHAPPIEAEVDGERLAKALAHLIADVAGIDSTGNTRAGVQSAVQPGGYIDSTIVVAAAQRGDVVRVEVRGPFTGGDPVHEPIVRGIVRAHRGVLQTHEVPGAGGRAYVLEVPIGDGAGTVAGSAVEVHGAVEQERAEAQRQSARRSSVDAFLDEGSGDGEPERVAPTGRRRGRAAGAVNEALLPAQSTGEPGTSVNGSGTGRRRGRPSPVEGAGTVPPQGAAALEPVATGRRARRMTGAGTEPDGQQHALPAAPAGGTAEGAPAPGGEIELHGTPPADDGGTPTGRRRRALAAAAERASEEENRDRVPFALPPAESDRHDGVPAGTDGHTPPRTHPAPSGRRRAHTDEPAAPGALVQVPAGPPGTGDGWPNTRLPEQQSAEPRLAEQQDHRARPALAAPPRQGAGEPRPVTAPAPAESTPAAPGWADAQGQAPAPGRASQQAQAQVQTQHWPTVPGQAGPLTGVHKHPGDAPEAAAGGAGQRSGGPAEAGGTGVPGAREAASPAVADGPAAPAAPDTPQPAAPPRARPLAAPSRPLPTETPSGDTGHSQGRPISVRTLGQGVPFSQQGTEQRPGTHPTPATGTPSGSGRRRKLAAPPAEDERTPAAPPAADPASPAAPQQRLGRTAPEGRSYAIGAPDARSGEGPEPLDGPNGAVEVAQRPVPRPMDDELPPEPLDNPRRLLVWPAPDASTEQALSERGYRPVVVHSREEVDAQIAAFPAALFVDPLTGPITRTALQSLRQAAVAAEVPVLVTAGLGQTTREAAYGADPAVLLKALAPRDSEQHPPRVLLIEEHEEIAAALTDTLERRGMQVARAIGDTDAVQLAAQTPPNLVVMDLMQVRRRRAGIVDWLRANGLLNRTPLVVYTAAGITQDQLPRLASGESVLFLAERSTSGEVQTRIVDLLAKIGTN